MEQDLLVKILSELHRLNSQVTGLAVDMADIKAKQIHDSDLLVKLNTKVDHGVVPTLDLVLESQKDIIRKMKEIEPKVESNQELKSRVATLEHIVESHSVQIQDLKKDAV